LYHDQAPPLINYFQSPLNEILHGGSEPVPNATLINEAQNVKFPIQAGKSYLFRIANMGAFAAQYLEFDQHHVTVVEMDGVYTQPYQVSQLFMPVAQRYSVILQAKANNHNNFAIVASMNDGMFDPGVTPPNLNNNVSLGTSDPDQD
jgi:iron transport multicopper oxidase